MNIGCYLPKSYEEFRNLVGVKQNLFKFEPDYNELINSESNNQWVLDRVNIFVKKITLLAESDLYSKFKQKLKLSNLVDEAEDVNALVRNIQFLEVFTVAAFRNDWVVKRDWEELVKTFRTFARRRRRGQSIATEKTKLLQLLSIYQKTHGAGIIRRIQDDQGKRINHRQKIVRDLFPYNITELYVKTLKPTKIDEVKARLGSTRIGLGMDSTFKPKKIDRDSVKIDDNTKVKSKHDKHIVYAAGWSLKAEYEG